MKIDLKHLIPAVAMAVLTTQPLPAQTVPGVLQGPSSGDTSDDAPVVLSPFSVESTRDNGFLKTTAVTADRFGTQILDTPVSISVVSRELLDTLGVDSSPQMFNYVSNVVTDFDNPASIVGANTAGPLVRGFRTAFVYQDGIRRPNSPYIDGIDRVEVVKGPVALYFGRSDPGGVINFISKKPEFVNRTTIEAKLGGDNFAKGMIDTQGVLAGDKLAYRVVGSMRDSDSWMDYTHWKEKYLQAGLAWHLGPKFDALVQVEHFDQFKTGGRVPAIVANLDYLRAAGAIGGGPNTLNYTDVDADNNPATAPIRVYETQTQWSARQFALTGKDERDYTGFYFPRGFAWSRNGPGSFDDNQTDTATLDLRFEPLEALKIRTVYNYTDASSAAFWFINQDPHQQPAAPSGNTLPLATLNSLVTEGSANVFTGINYGFFQSPFFNRTGTGGFIPGRQIDQTKTHTMQVDASYELDGAGGKHTFNLSAEYIDSQFTQFGYLVDPNAFVRAGGYEAPWFGADPYGGLLDAQSLAIVAQRTSQLQALGYLPTGGALPTSVFSSLFADVTNPNFTPPDPRQWIIGPTPNSVNGTDASDRGLALSYRGEFLDGRLNFGAGVRRSDFRTIVASETNGQRVRAASGWAKFTATTYTTSLLYKLGQGLNAYASYSENFYPRITAPNPVIKNTVTGETRGGDFIEPESGRGVEAGVKTYLQDGKISAGLAIFSIDRDKIPVIDSVFNNRAISENAASGGTNPWINVNTGAPITVSNRPNLSEPLGRQRVSGVEFEGVYTPGRSFQVLTAMAWNYETKWLSLPPSSVNINQGGTFTGEYNNDGRNAMRSDVIQDVPKVRLSVFGKYTVADGRWKGAYLGAGATWQSQTLLFDGSDPRFDVWSPDAYQKAYTTVDASIGCPITLAGRPLNLQFSVTNLTDTQYITGKFGPAPTREWKFTAAYKF